MWSSWVRSLTRSRYESVSSRALIWRERAPARARHAARTSGPSWRGLALWQATRPHKAPSLTIDTEAEAATPMFLRYWTWTGDTLRRAQSLMSRASGSCQAGVSGAGA